MKTLRLLLVLAALIPLAGCINLSFGSKRPDSPPPAPVVAVPPGPLAPSDAATIAEIDAAGRLAFDAGKKDALGRIARRPDLRPVAQVHLVKVIYGSVALDAARVELLRAVITNPAFSDAAHQAIVSQFGRLNFDANKQEILRELNQRITASSTPAH